jgi:uncharacterized protein DUF1697
MAMTTQVALLRGINVARNKRIPMSRLRELLAELSYAHVRTHLHSGDAISRRANGPIGSPARSRRPSSASSASTSTS